MSGLNHVETPWLRKQYSTNPRRSHWVSSNWRMSSGFWVCSAWVRKRFHVRNNQIIKLHIWRTRPKGESEIVRATVPISLFRPMSCLLRRLFGLSYDSYNYEGRVIYVQIEIKEDEE